MLAMWRKDREIKLQRAGDEEDVERGKGGGGERGTALTPHGTHKVAP